MTDRTIRFTLDGEVVEAHHGETVFEVARRLGKEIPHLCLSTAPDFTADGNCRLCMVEVAGEALLQASCIWHPVDGADIRIDGERAIAARRMVMELLLAEAPAIAADSEAARWLAALDTPRGRLPGETRHEPDRSHPAIALALDACILCLRCVQACRDLEANDVIGSFHRSHAARIGFDLDDPMGASTCVSCGDCVQSCPTGALSLKALP